MDIRTWLRDLGLEQYGDAFAANEIDAEILPKLTAEDLKDLGVTLVGHRRKLLEAIAALQATAAPEIELPADPAQAVRPEAERRQLTVMFVDLVGSTALSARLDPEDLREVIGGYQNTVAGEIARFGGHVAKFMGDGVLGYFGWPQAHEDDAERAVRAGLAIADEVSRLTTPAREPLAVRVGIATGQVVVGDLIGEGAAQEEAVVGETPNLAARLQGLAEPGQILIAESTRRLLGEVFELVDIGPTPVKGLVDPVRVFAIGAERTLESRFEAQRGAALLPMVGRDQELALLLGRWALARAGEGQGVLLVGEAGIGKSRIVRALLDAIAKEPHQRIRYQCSPYHGDSALWPVIQQLGRAAGLAGTEPLDTRLDRLEALLARAGNGADAAPLIADLLGLDGAARYGALNLAPQAQRVRTLEALVAQLLGLAHKEPVLVVLEDAHWIDPTTLELIELGLDRIGAARVLIVLTSRPDRQPGLAAQPHVTSLTLSRLGRAGVETIVTRLGGAALAGTVVDAIVARADGVPLFVEELTKAVLETGETTLPASLHDSLMARLDRLPEAKAVAQTAACIGREFPFALVAAVAESSEAELQGALDRLVTAGLMLRRGTPPDAVYAFRHALVQDAAHASLLRSRRRQLHARIARVLEESFPQTAEAEPEVLAHHLSEAGLSEQAIGYWRAAGNRARKRSAEREAAGHLSRAVALVRALPENRERDALEFDLCIELGGALIATRGYGAPECHDLFARAGELSHRLGDRLKLFPVLYGQWVYEHVNGHFTVSQGIGEQFLKQAEQAADPALCMIGDRLVGFTLLMRGRSEAALAHLRRSLAAYDPARHAALTYAYGQNHKIVPSFGTAFALHHLGHVEQAARTAREALAEARGLAHFNTLSWALWHGSILNLLQRQLPDVEELAAEAVALAEEHDAVLWGTTGRAILSCARAGQDASAENLAGLPRDIDAAHALPWGLFRPGVDLAAAEILIGAGQRAAARRLLDEMQPFIEAWDQRLFEAEYHRVRAETLVGSVTDEAEAHLLRALRVARGQTAKSWELRAATSLARLWAERSERQQAYDLLAPVYGWFTEGFETADLKDAKALLDQLT